eukprot:TRINITY_DN26346_c0_g1_i1.p1 TRINITY_DN26346_c0_g1~~TRINITY_DN26346_c0_g1_i1.p1  ORF type:complete len:115 (+),score=13.86 TRINITY_DN26346_c0_g1_i1:77-421(+)
MCIRDRYQRRVHGFTCGINIPTERFNLFGNVVNIILPISSIDEDTKIEIKLGKVINPQNYGNYSNIFVTLYYDAFLYAKSEELTIEIDYKRYEAEVTSETVSYTHLTLPTICSV